MRTEQLDLSTYVLYPTPRTFVFIRQVIVLTVVLPVRQSERVLLISVLIKILISRKRLRRLLLLLLESLLLLLLL